MSRSHTPTMSVDDLHDTASSSPTQRDSDPVTPSYPLLPSHRNRFPERDSRPDVMMPEPKPRDFAPYDSAPHQASPGHQRTETSDFRPHNRSSSSWDVLGGIRHSYVEFDPRHASQAHLAFAEGDTPKNGVSSHHHFCGRCDLFTPGDSSPRLTTTS